MNNEWSDTLEQLAGTQNRILAAIHGLPDDHLRAPEARNKWSVAEVIAHLGDLELITAVRLRMMLAMDRPLLPGWDHLTWLAEVHRDDSVAIRLEQLWFDRRRNLSLLRELPAGALARKGMHPEYGLLTIGDLVRRLCAHDTQHLAQIERIKAAHNFTATTTPWLDGLEDRLAAASSTRSPAPGITVRDVWQQRDRKALIVDIDPGASWEGLDHHQPGPEEVYVISGTFTDGVSAWEPGTFLHLPAGTSHIPSSTTGCSLFVFYPEG